jgi:hypothetical protein
MEKLDETGGLSNSKLWIAGMLSVLMLMTGLLISWNAQASGQASPASAKRPWQKIDDKAKAVKVGDRQATETLVDEIFTSFNWNAQLIGATTHIKERVVRSEMSYHNGSSRGIPEAHVANLINGWAARFNAPDYARTSQEEVRTIRVRLQPILPHLIDQGSSSKPVDLESLRQKKSLSSFLSPAEALYVTLALLDQKALNDNFQLTPAERAQRGRAKNIPPAPVSAETTRQQEMRRLIEREASNLGLLGIAALADEALNRLGMEQ